MNSSTQKFRAIIYTAISSQYILFIGFVVSLVVSIFYTLAKDARYATEKPEYFIIGSLITGALVLAAQRLKLKSDIHLSIKESAISVALTWFLACSISSLMLLSFGFPDMTQNLNITNFFPHFVDGFFESMSGFTTTGASVLTNVEQFPRSILFWRSLTHWIGGMGIAYFAVTLLSAFKIKREGVINAEAESPNYISFGSKKEAVESGIDFIKIYALMSGVLTFLLSLSGIWFRNIPYTTWYDNLFDSVTHTFATMGTGGFSIYNNSVGLPGLQTANNVVSIGGIQNPLSEWIIAFFMMFAGMNLGLWYVLVFQFKKNWKEFFGSIEAQIYSAFVFGSSFLIAIILQSYGVYSNFSDSLRYAFFNVATIVSTTGFGTTDFTKWPIAAQGVLFLSFLVGGMVGSTAGGLKFRRFIVWFEYLKHELHFTLLDKNWKEIIIDKVVYTYKACSLISLNILLYFLVFLSGSILIMVFNPIGHNGQEIDFGSSFGSSIAMLGNIGPAATTGLVNAGPAGNYSEFSVLAKIVMIILMFIGRVGVFTFIILFVNKAINSEFEKNLPKEEFDPEDSIAIRG
jgi:trk system potassium uptake protein